MPTRRKTSRTVKARSAPAISSIDRLRADKRVEIVDDERPEGGNLVITMAEGWTLDARDPHDGVFGADTLTEAWETLRRATFHGELKQAA